MGAVFTTGSLVRPEDGQTLAEVYCFIQWSLAPESSQCDCRGFIDPTIEYEPLTEALQRGLQGVLQLDDGTRINLKIDFNASWVGNQIVYFSGKLAPRDLPNS